MNCSAVRFRQIVLIGVLVNLCFALPGVFIPNAVLDLVGGEPTAQMVWPGFASFLLILLSLFYIPAALDPLRYLPFAWLTVLARVGGVLFFFVIYPGEYPLFGWIDLVFALLGGWFLMQAIRRSPATAS